jgi:hypothetical protein
MVDFDFDVVANRGASIPEPPVNGAVGCPKGGDRLIVLSDVVEVGPHHLPQQSLATMGGQDGHCHSPPAWHFGAGHRHRHGEGARGGHYLPVLEDTPGPVEGKDTCESAVSLGRVESENEAHGPAQSLELARLDGPDFEGHQATAITRLGLPPPRFGRFRPRRRNR